MEVQHTHTAIKIEFNSISVNVSSPAGLPLSLPVHSSVEIRNGLITACWNGAGHWTVPRREREGRQPQLGLQSKG